MRAVVIRFGLTPQVREVPRPQRAPDGAVIRVKATGLCRSDWHGWLGHASDITLPQVPGHEFAGLIAEVGADVRTVAGRVDEASDALVAMSSGSAPGTTVITFP